MKRIDPIGQVLDTLHAPPERPGFFAELRRRAEEQQRTSMRRARRQARALALAAAALLVAVGLLLGFGSPFVHAGSSDALASGGLVETIQDTTVSCVSSTGSGAHAFDVFFWPKQTTPAFLGVAGPGSYSMVSVVSSKIGVGLLPTLASYNRGVGVSRRHCRRISARVPLSRGSLPGPPTRYGAEGHCILDGRVIVRARAIWDGRGFSGMIAVRLASGPQVGFAWIRRDGTGGLYISNRCELVA
jgi:hypothetical protein